MPEIKPEIKTNPDIAPLIAQAQAYARMGKHIDAAEFYRRAINAGDNTRITFFYFVVSLMESGETTICINTIQEYLKQQPNDFSFLNLLGVVYKRVGRFKDALVQLTRARDLEPQNNSTWLNLGNVYMDLREGKKAEEMFLKAAELTPGDAEPVRLAGRALQSIGAFKDSESVFQRALAINPANAHAVADLARTLAFLEQSDEAIALLDERLAKTPDDVILLNAKGWIYKKNGKMDQAVAVFEALTRINPNDVEGWTGLAQAFEKSDREKANGYYRKAVEVDNHSLRTLGLLSDSLNRSRYGNEADHIQESYDIACEMVEKYPTRLMECSEDLKSILVRCVDFDRMAKMGDPRENRDYWLRKERIAAFHYEMARVETMDDRLELVRYHREWGIKVDAKAASMPLKWPEPVKHDKIRVGFMSSDLRAHPVSYFALPLFEHYDKSKFEVFCYSFFMREEDAVQKHIASIVDHFRWWPLKTDFEVAQGIANDQLDIIFELGGTTDMNKLQVMSYRPAPVQVSWLGYPHSSGLGSIDYIVVDPYLKPSDERLLIEKPFELPETWVPLSRAGFYNIPIDPVIPEDRKGHITFGTMNNPYKYTRDLIGTWAAIMNRVPNSRFLFVRPEGAVPAFRKNMEAEFASHGIAADRIEYVAVRGKHMPHYNDIDIALDSFPHVGGTTTCETLWMGVPVVTLVGPAFFERLSYTNLNNAGLGDLCAFTKDEYIEKALALVADKPRRAYLRNHLRTQLREQPLGQPDRFADNFYKKVEEVLR